MKAIWLRRAAADLRIIRAYIAEHDPRAAVSVAQRIKQTVEHVKVHPQMGRQAARDDVRLMTVPGLPYLVPYRVRNNRIEILRVFHTAQVRPSSWDE
jgi:toxin ParE1/3/4